jgi:hypothetical protein
MRFLSIYLLIPLLASSASVPAFAAIRDEVKPGVYKRAVEERDIQVGSRLTEVSQKSGVGEFKFYGLMLVHASPAKARAVLLDYPLYQKMVPYVSRSQFDEKEKLLWIEGGIFGWNLKSAIRLEVKSEQSPVTIDYSIEKGHFKGLKGKVVIESVMGERASGKSLVHFTGGVTGKSFPPAWIMERGSEIVFGLTARRMRSLMESETTTPPAIQTEERPTDHDLPKPRKRI